MNRQRKISIKDVARKANVAVSTASLALNGGALVAAATRQRVLETADLLGYVGNQAASRLKRGRTGTIGILVHPNANEYHFDVAMRTQQAVLEHGYAAGFFFIDVVDPDGLRRFFKEVYGQVDGVVAYTGPAERQVAEKMREFGIGCVFNRDTRMQGCDFVSPDFVGGGRIATEYLIGKGHRRIATFYTAPEQSGASIERYHGYLAAMDAAGLPTDGLTVELTGSPYCYQDLYQLAVKLLATKPTAIFMRSDYASIPALRALYDHGLAPGKDVDIVGFDNIGMGKYTRPALTTIDCDNAGLARRLVEIIIAQLNDPAAPPQRVYVPSTLVRRESA